MGRMKADRSAFVWADLMAEATVALEDPDPRLAIDAGVGDDRVVEGDHVVDAPVADIERWRSGAGVGG